MVANVVLRMEFFRGEELIAAGNYRGDQTVGNWASGDGEIQGMISQAFAEALVAVNSDIRKLCLISS